MNINPFIDLIASVLHLYKMIVIVWMIMFWLIEFDVVNRHNNFINKLMYVCGKIVDPVLSKIRSIIPNIGGLDISPILLFLLLNFANNFLYTYFYK